jgi:hypothetical protein
VLAPSFNLAPGVVARQMLRSACGATLSLRGSESSRKIFPDRSVRNISFDLGAVSKDSPPDGRRTGNKEIKD